MRSSGQLLAVLCAILYSVEGYVRMCYMTNWAKNRRGIGRYPIRQYNTDETLGLCTHLIYAFAKVTTANGFAIVPYDRNDIGSGYPAVSSTY